MKAKLQLTFISIGNAALEVVTDKKYAEFSTYLTLWHDNENIK